MSIFSFWHRLSSPASGALILALGVSCGLAMGLAASGFLTTQQNLTENPDRAQVDLLVLEIESKEGNGRIEGLEQQITDNVWNNYAWRMTVPDTLPGDYLPGGFPNPRVDELIGEGEFPVAILEKDWDTCLHYVANHPEDAWLDLTVNGESANALACKPNQFNELVWTMEAEFAAMVGS